jgi:hypothetical protein
LFFYKPGSVLTDVALAEQLHAHDGEDEDDDAENEGQVAEGADGLAHDGDEQVERRPRFRKLEHSQLKGHKTKSEAFLIQRFDPWACTYIGLLLSAEFEPLHPGHRIRLRNEGSGFDSRQGASLFVEKNISKLLFKIHLKHIFVNYIYLDIYLLYIYMFINRWLPVGRI